MFDIAIQFMVQMVGLIPAVFAIYIIDKVILEYFLCCFLEFFVLPTIICGENIFQLRQRRRAIAFF